MPIVSIVLPTYNRARFLPQALQSIQEQSWPAWELLVVDDGSTDDTEAVIAEWRPRLSRSLRYLRQPNGGPAAARNTGIDQATGEYVAFFDSDDAWLPHHLADCVAALEANPTVDWVYAAGRRVDLTTGRVLLEHSFHPPGETRQFLHLQVEEAGPLRIFADPDTAACQIRDGLYCGLQNSVLRRRVFESLRLPPFRIAEDRLFTLMALERGFRLGYLDDVHVVYHVHPENSSGGASDATWERKLGVQQELIRCYEHFGQHVRLGAREQQALNASLGYEYFWHLGYSLLWQHGRRKEALAMLRRGLRYRPFDLRCWKTYLLCWGRWALGISG